MKSVERKTWALRKLPATTPLTGPNGSLVELFLDFLIGWDLLSAWYHCQNRSLGLLFPLQRELTAFWVGESSETKICTRLASGETEGSCPVSSPHGYFRVTWKTAGAGSVWGTLVLTGCAGSEGVSPCLLSSAKLLNKSRLSDFHTVSYL